MCLTEDKESYFGDRGLEFYGIQGYFDIKNRKGNSYQITKTSSFGE